MTWIYLLLVVSFLPAITNEQAAKVSVTSVLVNIGDSAALTCSVSVSLEDLPLLVSVNVAWTPDNKLQMEDVEQNGNIFTSHYEIDSVSSTNAVQYNCSVVVLFVSDKITSSITATETGTVYTADMIQSPPNTSVVLDTSPYNVFTTQCTLTYYPDNAPATPTVSFSLISTNAGDSDSQDSVTDTNTNPVVSTRSVTVAKAKLNSKVTYQYTCHAMVDVDDIDPITVQSNTSNVTVRGPTNPVSAIKLQPTNIVDTMATIQWIIPRVSYTPETYVIHYGPDQDNLNMMSEPVAGYINGGSFLTDENLKYKVTLQDLTYGAQYWYHVSSTNTEGSNVSEIDTFTAAEAAPEPPRDFTLIISSTILRLTWDESAVTNGVILYYNYSCSDTNSSADINRIGSTEPSTFTTDITNLQPYIEYMCNLTASTSAGTSGPVTDTAVTGQAAPSGPPTQFNVTSSNDDPTQLMLSWKPPELESRNGIIIMYYYNCSNDTYSTDEGSTMGTTANVDGLAVFTNYTCTVRAATSEGRGPFAVFDGARTGEGAPSAVRGLSFKAINRTTFSISWNMPEFPNGIIANYSIKVVDYTDASVVEQYNTGIPLTSTTVLGSFLTGVPYYVDVTAFTGGGEGPKERILIFTEEGKPAQVQGVMVERINGTAARVSWTPLTLLQAKGFLDNLVYRVTLTPVMDTRKRQSSTSITQSFSSNVSSGVITGLDWFTSYRVAVVAVVSGQPGDTSEPTEVPPIQISTGSFGDLVYIIIFGVVIILIVSILVIIVIVWMIKTRERNYKHYDTTSIHYKLRHPVEHLDTESIDEEEVLTTMCSRHHPSRNSESICEDHMYNSPSRNSSLELHKETQLIQHVTAENSQQPDDLELGRTLIKQETLSSVENLKKRNSQLASVDAPSEPIQYMSIPFTDEGLFYHSHDYGITVIIPPGAVQGPAVLQFGATQLLQGFKSELDPDCYPVSPFVWIHTEPILTKPAELYIPHCVDTTTNGDTEIHLLTRNHQEEIFKINDRIGISVSVNLARLISTHFCCLCLATAVIPKKRYLLVCAWKQINPDTIHWDICVLHSWQCLDAFKRRHQGYKIKQQPISSFEELTVRINFPANSEWEWSYRRDSSVDFKVESIKEEDVDLYKVLGLNPGDTISDDDKKTLQHYEDNSIYPKCLKLSFNRRVVNSEPKESCKAEISVFSCNSKVPRLSLILFDSKGDYNDEPGASSIDTIDVYTATNGDHVGGSTISGMYNDHEKKKDRLVIDAMAFLQPRICDYFRFGYYLGIPIDVLQTIEKSVGPIPERCVKNILLYWRKTSKDVSSKAIANALEASGLPLLAAIASNQFECTTALFCCMCDKPHGERRSATESLCHVLNSNITLFEKRPDLADLVNLVVARIPARWMEFGVQLGIELSEMEAIKVNTLGNCKLCFIELLDLWRRRGSTNYTWSTVIKVLHSPSLKEYLLAEEIYKFCLQNNSSSFRFKESEV